MMRQNLWAVIALVAVCLLSVGIGFFFGRKSAEVGRLQVTSSQAELDKIANSKQTEENTETVIVELPEVYFFELEQARECPFEYPVKAKFGSDAPIFYTTENQFYDRVVPHLCLPDAETARSKGFLEKK